MAIIMAMLMAIHANDNVPRMARVMAILARIMAIILARVAIIMARMAIIRD